MKGAAVLVLLLAVVGLSSATVTVITDANYQAELKDSKTPVFVDLYATWCGHCKNLAPTWVEVGKVLSPEGIKVAKIDVPANPVLGSLFKVRGFPTLYLVVDGKAYQYKGPRSKADLLKFARAGYKDGDYIEPFSAWGEALASVTAVGGILEKKLTEWRRATTMGEVPFAILVGLGFSMGFMLIFLAIGGTCLYCCGRAADEVAAHKKTDGDKQPANGNTPTRVVKQQDGARRRKDD